MTKPLDEFREKSLKRIVDAFNMDEGMAGAARVAIATRTAEEIQKDLDTIDRIVVESQRLHALAKSRT